MNLKRIEYESDKIKYIILGNGMKRFEQVFRKTPQGYKYSYCRFSRGYSDSSGFPLKYGEADKIGAYSEILSGKAKKIRNRVIEVLKEYPTRIKLFRELIGDLETLSSYPTKNNRENVLVTFWALKSADRAILEKGGFSASEIDRELKNTSSFYTFEDWSPEKVEKQISNFLCFDYSQGKEFEENSSLYFEEVDSKRLIKMRGLNSYELALNNAFWVGGGSPINKLSHLSQKIYFAGDLISFIRSAPNEYYQFGQNLRYFNKSVGFFSLAFSLDKFPLTKDERLEKLPDIYSDMVSEAIEWFFN
jgi:hypothetical protein